MCSTSINAPLIYSVCVSEEPTCKEKKKLLTNEYWYPAPNREPSCWDPSHRTLARLPQDGRTRRRTSVHLSPSDGNDITETHNEKELDASHELLGKAVEWKTKMDWNIREFEDLREVLEKAAMDGKTIILTEVSEAWTAPDSIMDTFLESFHAGDKIEHLLQNLVIVAMDQIAFNKCKSVHPHCYHFKMEGVNFTTEKVFMTNDFIELVWTKIMLQQYILQFGYNFLFTDMDVLWFRNPFLHINVYSDITLSTDHFVGDPEDLRNEPNTGFFYVKASNKTAEILKYWYEARKRFPQLNEQRTLYAIKGEIMDKFAPKVKYIDTKYFGGFCSYGRDLNEIYTMHSTCCETMARKVSDLRSLLVDWKNYTTLSIEEKNKGLVSWRVPGQCIR